MFGWLSAETARASRTNRAFRVRVGHALGWQHFDRNEPAETRILRLVDHTHTALADLLDDPVVGEGGPDHARGKVNFDRLKALRILRYGLTILESIRAVSRLA